MYDLATIQSITSSDNIPEALYKFAPLQWKIGTGRDIREPFLVGKEDTYKALCAR